MICNSIFRIFGKNIKQQIIFHNGLKSNDGRGFEVVVVVVYNDRAKKDLEFSEIKDYKENVKKIYNNNPGAVEIFKIDIDPTQKTQILEVNSLDNVLECFIFAYFQNLNSAINSRLMLGKEFQKDKIFIECDQPGISIKKQKDFLE